MAFVALGSNLGRLARETSSAPSASCNRSPTCRCAAPRSGKPRRWTARPARRSSSTPWRAWSRGPLKHRGSLLAQLQSLEKEMGRAPRRILNEPRVIDLDLIAFGSQTMVAPDLVLPHPRAHLRRFVLQPLSEIAPDYIFPGQDKTVSELLRRLDSSETLRRLPACFAQAKRAKFHTD